MPESILVDLYYRFVYPYLLYCNLVWGGCVQAHINDLLLIQKKIVRLITNQHYLAHTNPLFYRTRILKVSDIHLYLLGIEAYKQNYNSNFNYTTHRYNTR